ncbi:MAG: hypothetical protein MH472_06460 [Bacteroidia bacterium]|nr:hypothetical protein [Bacteroidia bacterium]
MNKIISICITIIFLCAGKTDAFSQNKIYESQKDGFKIKYPANLTIKSGANKETIFKAVKKNENNFVVFTVNTSELDTKTAKLNEENFKEMLNALEKAYKIKTSKHKFQRRGKIRILSFENLDPWGNLNITYFYIYPNSLFTVVFNCDLKYFNQHENEIFESLNSFQSY